MDQQPNTFTPAPKQSNGFAVGSLVCGIVSLVMTFFTAAYYPLFVGVVLGIIAIVLAVLAKKKGPSGMATAGLVLGIIGLVFCGIFAIACSAAACAVSNAVDDAFGSNYGEVEDALNQIAKELENITY